MKKITKRIMALMLSLVMLLGCMPSFTNVVSAAGDPSPKYSYIGIEVTKGGIGAKPYDYGFTLYAGDDPTNLTFSHNFIGSDFAWFVNDERIETDRSLNYRTKKDTTYKLKLVYYCNSYGFDVKNDFSLLADKSSDNVISAGYNYKNNQNYLEFTFIPDALAMNLWMSHNTNKVTSVSEGTYTTALSFYTEDDKQALSCTIDRLSDSVALSPENNVVELNAEFYKGNSLKGFSESNTYPLTENNTFYVDEANNKAKIRYAIPITGAISDVDLFIEGTAEEGDTAPTMKFISSSTFYKSEENDALKAWRFTDDCSTPITEKLKKNDYISKLITITALDDNVFNISSKLNINIKGTKPEVFDARIYDMAADRKLVRIKVVIKPNKRKLEVNYKLPTGYTATDVTNFTTQTSTLEFNHGTSCELSVHPANDPKGWMIVLAKVIGAGTYSDLSGGIYLNGIKTLAVLPYAEPDDYSVYRSTEPYTYFKDGDIYIYSAYDFTQTANLDIETELVSGIDITTVSGKFDDTYNCTPEIYVKNDSTFDKITTGTFTPGKEYRLIFEHEYTSDYLDYMAYVRLNGSGISKGTTIDDSTKWTTKYIIEDNKVKIPYIYNCEKIKLKNIDLIGNGQLLADVDPSNQTIKFTGPDDAKYTVQTEPITVWYKDEYCSTGDEVSTFELGKKYYAKVKVTANTGYEFLPYADRQQMNITTTKGRYADYKTPNYPNYDVVNIVVEVEAEEKTITIDYSKPATLADYKNITIDNDYTYDGVTNKPSVNNSLELSVLNRDNAYKGIYVLDTTLSFDTEEELLSVKKIIIRGQNIYTDDYKATGNYGEFLVSHDIAWYKSGYSIGIVEKLDFRKNENITFNQAPDMTVEDVLASVTFEFGDPEYMAIHSIIDNLANEMNLNNTDKLEAGKKYRIRLVFKVQNEKDLVSVVKINNNVLSSNNSLNIQEDGWMISGDNIEINYTFDCQNQSSGGSRKKKKTETKPAQPVEPQKTLEEKLQEELKKDDVKKANSNEKENINPQAKYINGYDDGTFKANSNVSNIELMSMVTQLFDNVEIKETKDLNQGDDYWGQEIIDKANALGLVPGNKDSKNYNVADEVTRGDLAVVVYNLVKDFSSAPSLKDRDNCKDAIGTGYEKEAAKLLELGIFKGYDDGLFHGDYTLTRAEAVVVINRALKSLGFEINMPKISLSFPDLTPDHWAYAEIMYAANK